MSYEEEERIVQLLEEILRTLKNIEMRIALQPPSL